MSVDSPLLRPVEHVTVASRHIPETGSRSDLLVIELADAATADTVGDLLVALPAGWGIGYFDEGFPSPSDPGAYFTVWRDADGLLIAWGNHGWSTTAKLIATVDAVSHLWACRAMAPSSVHPPLQLVGPDYAWHRERTGKEGIWPFRKDAALGPEPTPGEHFERRLAELR